MADLLSFLGFLAAVLALVFNRRLGRKVARQEERIATLTGEQAELGAALRRMEEAARSTVVAPPPSAAEAGVGPVIAMTEVEFAALPPMSEDELARAALAAAAEMPGLQVSGLPEPPPPEAPAPERRVILTADTGARLTRFLRDNWVYVVSALSLALAGVFLVQYGIDRGLLPPAMRVAAGIALGLALIGAGEYLRRRFGDAPDGTVAFLPATFSGAGIVSIFAAVLAARQMYGLIGPEAALAGLVATALLAVVLGWFNGSFLVAVGILGAFAAPFVVGGGGTAPDWLYLYFALVTAMGLAVDTVRRWAWVSVLALAAGFAGGALTDLAGASAEGWIGLMVALPLLATILPERGLVPRQAGPCTAQTRGRGRLPPFPVRLVVGTLALSSVALTMQTQGLAGPALMAYGALTLLALAYLLWADQADGLADVAALPALGFLAGAGLSYLSYPPLMQSFLSQAIDLRPPETGPSWQVSWIAGMAALIAIAAAWRALRPGVMALWQGLGAVWMATLTIAALQLAWAPDAVLGPFPWALHPMAVAALMVIFAQRFAARDGEDHRRAAHATLAALTLVALALFVITGSLTLTLALAVLLVAAAALDARFRLPEMGLFLQAGAAVLSWRLHIDPGLDWAFSTTLAAVSAAFLGPILAGVAALWLMRGLDRPITRGVMESALALWITMLLDVWLFRWIDSLPSSYSFTYWTFSLMALPWTVMMLVQIYRRALGGRLRLLRLVLAILSALPAAGLYGAAVTILNPLTSFADYDKGGLVLGPMILDTLAVAYLLPGLILLAAGLSLPGVGPRLRPVLLVVGAGSALLYLGLEIRRFWKGDWLGGATVLQGELYTYTLAMMILGAALLFAALVRRSHLLRRIAMTMIAVTIAKVFLIDASGLTGLTRVASFLGLGLSLAGLAWLNRWVGQVASQKEAG